MGNLKRSVLPTLAVLAASATGHAAVEARAGEFLESANRTAARLTSCPASADDVVSQVALRLWSRHSNILLEGSSHRAYVDTSLRNARRDQLRRRRMISFSELDESNAPQLAVAPATTATPMESAGLHEFRARLGADDQEILSFLEAGHAEREIARRTGKSRHQVRTCLMRIRRRATDYFECPDLPCDDLNPDG